MFMANRLSCDPVPVGSDQFGICLAEKQTDLIFLVWREIQFREIEGNSPQIFSRFVDFSNLLVRFSGRCGGRVNADDEHSRHEH